jgi:DNA-binding Lrp family transcriptional regulator
LLDLQIDSKIKANCYSESAKIMTDNIPPPFDTLDYQIIRALRRNIRVDAAKIARVVDANERTVRKRVDRLVSLGAVRLAAIVSPRAFGYVTEVSVFLEVEPEHEEEVVEQFLAMQEIRYVAYGLGDREIAIQARFKDNDEMREFLRRTLPSIPGVKVTSYALVPRILRSIDEWMPKPEDFRPKLKERRMVKG